MAKEITYFRFTVHEWQNGDISVYDYDVKGLFIDICCWYWAKNCSITIAKLKQKYKHCYSTVEVLINDDIIKLNKKTEKIEILFLDEQFIEVQKTIEARRSAGLKGAKARYGKAIAKPKLPYSYKDKDKDKDKDNKGDFYQNQLISIDSNNENLKYYKAFINLINGENDLKQPLTGILKMPDQMTFEQFCKLHKLAKDKNLRISELLLTMENGEYYKGKKSIYATLRNWINR